MISPAPVLARAGTHPRPAVRTPVERLSAGPRAVAASVRDQPIDWEVTHSLDGIEQIWRAFEASAVCTPFQRFDWVSAIRRSEPHIDARFVLGRRDGALVIILPLCVTRTALGARLGWLCERQSDYHMPLVAPDLFAALTPGDVAAILVDVRALTGHPDAIVLRRQPVEIDGLRNPFAAWNAAGETTSAYAVRLFGPWSDFHPALYSSSMRKRLRQRTRRLEEAGRFERREIHGAEDIARHLDAMLDWKAEQLAERGAVNMLARREDREYLFDLVRARNSPVRLFAASVDGRPIAVMFTLEQPEKLVVYQMGYERGTYDRYSPGALLLMHVMQAAIGEGKTLLDLSVGDEPYKKDICDVQLELAAGLRAFTPRGHVLIAKQKLAMALKNALKASPRAVAALLALRARLLALRG